MLGAGADASAIAVESTVRVIAVLVGLGLVIAGVGISVITGDAFVIHIAWVLGAAILFHVDQFVHRSRLEFTQAGLQQIVFGVGLLGGAAWLVTASEPSITGVVIAYGAAMALSVAAFFRLKLHHRVEWSALARLTSIGFPIMLAGLSYALMTTADRWIAAFFLEPNNAGAYAFASVLAASLAIAPTVVSQQTYPRMAMAYGAGASWADLRRMARRQGMAAMTSVAVLGTVLFTAAYVAIPIYMPAYVTALPGIAILCVGLLFLSLSAGIGNYLNVVGAHWLYLTSQASALVVAGVLMFFGVRTLGLIGIATGLASSWTIYSVILLSGAHLYERRHE